MKLTINEIRTIRQLQDAYGLNVSSIGSPIGKVKLLDVDDGTQNVYIPFDKYLAHDVAKACELAHAFETKLIRGFSFYHPRGTDPAQHLPQAIDHLGHIAEVCHRSDLTFGLELEANLVGQTGPLLAEIWNGVEGQEESLRRRSVVRELINRQVTDIIEETARRLSGLRADNPWRNAAAGYPPLCEIPRVVDFSPRIRATSSCR